MWLALEAADEENGCLHYVQGSLQQGMRDHGFSDVMGFSQTILDYEASNEDEIVMVARPGDLIIHHSLMVHRAGANASDTRSRRAIGAVFYGESAQTDMEKYEARQQEIQERAAKLKGQSTTSVGL